MIATPISATERQTRSGVTLANAAEITANIIRDIAGNDISTSINGATATAGIIQTIAIQRIGRNLEKRNGGV